MTIAAYPDLPGLEWPVTRTPIFTNLVRALSSQREVRAQLMSVPRYEFDLSYGFLRETGTFDELTSIEELFLQSRGQYDRFAFTDRNDNTATAVQIGTGDGTTRTFTLGRHVGPSFYEAVGYVASVTSLTVAGTPAAFTLNVPNTVTLAAAPTAGQAVVATFPYSFVCRFKQDAHEYAEFAYRLYELQQVTLRTTEY